MGITCSNYCVGLVFCHFTGWGGGGGGGGGVVGWLCTIGRNYLGGRSTLGQNGPGSF